MNMRANAVIVVAGLCMAGLAKASAAESDTVVSWAPEPAMLEQLDAEAAMPGFAIRPPKGYQHFQQRSGPPGVTVFSWSGDQRPDGTTPYVMVTIAVAPPDVSGVPPGLERALDTFLEGVHRRRVDWARTPVERGRLGGLEFARAYWDGTELASQRKMHGFAYVAVDGRGVVQLSSQDIEPHHESALRVAEAAALTFKKF